MSESLPIKTRLLLAGASLQLISLAKKAEKSKKEQVKPGYADKYEARESIKESVQYAVSISKP